MKKKLLLISALLASLAVAPAYGAEKETHSVYRVTTYNLGALLGDQSGGRLSLQNYEPLLITSTKSDILNSENQKSASLVGAAPDRGTKGFAIAAEYSATPKIAVQGVLGVTQNMVQYQPLDADASWEANLGVIYRFFDNLSYEVHFGYMDAGDVLKDRSSYTNDESIIMISNKITLSF